MRSYLFVVVAILNIGCSSQAQKVNYHYLTEIKDDTLTKTIVDYVTINSIDVKSHFIIVDFSDYGPKDQFGISAGESLQGIANRPPDYFAFVKGVLVLLDFSHGDVALGGVAEELHQFVREKGIKLQDTVASYDPPLWVLNRCGDNYELIKKIDPFTQDFLPCGYYLRRDLKTDSIWLEKSK